MQKLIVSAALLGTAATVLLPSGTAHAQDEVIILHPSGPSWVQIASTDAMGSGCPSGIAKPELIDTRVLLVDFSGMQAKAGPEYDPEEGRKFCQLTIALSHPAGFSYSISRVYSFGYAYLEPGVTATHDVDYWFLGSRGPSAQTRLPGPFVGMYNQSEVFEEGERAWSPCNASRPLMLKSSLSVSNVGAGTKQGFMYAGAWGSRSMYMIDWRRCS